MSTNWEDVKDLYDNSYKDDLIGARDWCNELYNDRFSIYFEKVRELYPKFQNRLNPIADSDIEWILMDLPMNMIAASEALNNTRLEFELMKLKKNEIKSKSSGIMSKGEVISYMLPHELLVSAYGSVISRVENELSFSRELIMGAKKVWDSRRSGENIHPVSPVVPDDLPEYGNYDDESSK